MPCRQPAEHQRPHPVELLLDGQRPVVLERRPLPTGGGQHIGVTVPRREQHPVLHLQRRAEQVAFEVGHTVEQPEPRTQGDADDAHGAGREQPAGSTGENAPTRTDPVAFDSARSRLVIRYPDNVKKTETPM